MSDQHSSEDQAEKLRGNTEDGGFENEELDILDLPPRKNVHEGRKEKTRWRVNAIWMRFLFVILLILIIVILSYPYWDVWFGQTFPKPAIIEESPYHEQITVER
ncbi:hypothetical protein [Halobacillus aidingensis]|uniref:Uncharacterized protein n=1 Tax=Halobacillus aidingensis TaxID=240303 RepID=A0A1H0SSQ7_HALAD|nr:hypothetical protein [Halobacillus aidingensis]SDP44812.1 hypothetical protein SAMN05421677_11913 [Halobacillus aidingensis]